MKKFLSILLLFSASLLFSQEDGKTWLDRMNKTYGNATSLSMSFVVDYFPVSSQLSPASTMKGEIRSSGTNYYSDAMGQIVLINNKYMLIIDKTQHTITCLPGSGTNKPDDSQVAAGSPDSSWAQASKIKLLNTDGASRRIELSGNDPVYEKTEITINATNYQLEQVVFYYRKLEDGSSPKLIVRYSNVKINSGLNDSEFSEKKYIQKKNGELIASPAWSNYKVIDLMEEPE